MPAVRRPSAMASVPDRRRSWHEKGPADSSYPPRAIVDAFRLPLSTNCPQDKRPFGRGHDISPERIEPPLGRCNTEANAIMKLEENEPGQTRPALLRAVPNLLTLTRLALGVAFPLIPAGWRVTALLVAAATEFLDGQIARLLRL